MSQPLGKVTTNLDVPRGADAEARITVAPEWLAQGDTIEIQLSNPLVCAACHGGGCDACERSGAVRLTREQDAPRSPLLLGLPRREPSQGEFALRLPHQAAWAADPALPRGHLVVIVQVAEAGSLVSAGVRRMPSPTDRAQARAQEQQLLLIRSLIVAAFLILTFVGLLRLSGWL